MHELPYVFDLLHDIKYFEQLAECLQCESPCKDMEGLRELMTEEGVNLA